MHCTPHFLLVSFVCSMAFRSAIRRILLNSPSSGLPPPGNYLELTLFRINTGTGRSRWKHISSSVVFTRASTLSQGCCKCQRGYSSEVSLVEKDRGSSVDGIKDADSHANSLNQGPRISERHNLVMVFTCNVCQTRSAKTMSRQTYEKGVVIVRCFTCKNLHLIADRLGWFGEPGSVEDFLNEKGIEVRKGCEESYEFSVEDLAGWSPRTKDKGVESV